MSEIEAQPQQRVGVSTLELFFDLVFVFTITQLTRVLAAEPNARGVGQATLMLGVIFWMYGGYAWLTNSVALDRLSRRLTLVGGMAGFLVVALAVPRAFAGSGATFGLAYLAVVLIHLTMFARASQMSARQAIVRLAPFNLSTAVLVLIGGILGGSVQYACWAGAFVLEWVSPKLIDDSGFIIEPGHFVERHGLVVLVAIGESVVAVGIGAGALPVNAALVAAAVLGLALSACLWWTHFGSEEGTGERALSRAPAAQRPRLAINAFGYCYLLILLGIIAIATALKKATGHPFDVLPIAEATALGAGCGAFLLGETLFRATLTLGSTRAPALAAALALTTIPIGSQLAAAAQIVLLVALFVAMLISVSRHAQR